MYNRMQSFRNVVDLIGAVCDLSQRHLVKVGDPPPRVQRSRLVSDNHCHCLLFLIPKTVLRPKFL